MQASGGFPSGGRRSFFKSLHRLGILLIGPRSGAHMRKAQVLQGAVDRVVRHREPELLMQPHDQVARAPAHHTMDRRDGPSWTIRARKALCVSLSLGGAPSEGILTRPSGPCSLKRITKSRSDWRPCPRSSLPPSPSSLPVPRRSPAADPPAHRPSPPPPPPHPPTPHNPPPPPTPH